MKIAVPTNNNAVDNHFGHCNHFTIFEIENNKIVKETKLEPGVSCGCKSNLVNDLKTYGVEVLLVGQIGQGAVDKITNSQIKVIRGCSGNVEKVVTDYLEKKLTDSFIVCSPHSHDNGQQCNH